MGSKSNLYGEREMWEKCGRNAELSASFSFFHQDVSVQCWSDGFPRQFHFEDPTLLNLSGPVGDDFFKAFRPVWEGLGRGCLCMIMSLSLRIWVLAEVTKGSVSYLSSPCFSTSLGGIGGPAHGIHGILAVMYWISIIRGGGPPPRKWSWVQFPRVTRSRAPTLQAHFPWGRCPCSPA